jgi:hypothetical protein
MQACRKMDEIHRLQELDLAAQASLVVYTPRVVYKPRAVQTFPLLALPGEIRNNIYKYCVEPLVEESGEQCEPSSTERCSTLLRPVTSPDYKAVPRLENMFDHFEQPDRFDNSGAFDSCSQQFFGLTQVSGLLREFCPIYMADLNASVWLPDVKKYLETFVDGSSEVQHWYGRLTIQVP